MRFIFILSWHVDTQPIVTKGNGMDNTKMVVDYLKKVTLELEAGSQPDDTDLTNGPVKHTFVYGVASDGITPFERAFFLGAEGDSHTFDIQGENARNTLGHLRSALLGQLPVSPPFFLKARITQIAQAGNREVVRAIAATINDCSNGGDCGCGCS
jgi:hypothetical protein